ncbi:diguanylate cyclase domain-containing protein [Microbacteriaceae bacterium 4G12]
MNAQFIIAFVIGIVVGIAIIVFLCKSWRKRKEELIKEYKRLVKVMENTKDLLYYYQVKPERQFKYVSPSAETLLGKGIIEEAYRDPDTCYRYVHPDDYEVLHKKIMGELDYNQAIIQRWKNRDDGQYKWFEEYTTPIYENGELVAIQGVVRDIDEKMELQQELQYRIDHDVLTDIYNRGYFEQEFSKLDEENNTSAAVILCDLDELKFINDNCGHEEGDLLIKEAAKILNKFSSNKITVARIGGDEFVLLVALKDEQEVQRLVTRIEQELDTYNNSSLDMKIQMSIGYAFTPSSIGNMTALLAKADKNMYIEKKQRKQLSGERV